MIPFVVVGFSALFVVVKLFERRLGKAIVRAGIAFLLVVPLMGVAYAAWTLSRHWVAPVDLGAARGLRDHHRPGHVLRLPPPAHASQLRDARTDQGAWR